MIEDLRYLLQSAPAMYLGQVIQTSDLDEEKTEYLVRCRLLPDKGEVVAHATYSLGGGQEKAQANDVVLVAFPGNDAEYAVVVTILSNDARLLHPRTDSGDVVLVSRPGMKTNIVSDTRVNIGKGGETEEDEPLVLGNTLKTFMETVFQKVETLAGEVKKIADETKTALDLIKTGPITAPGTPAGGPATADGLTWPALATALATPISNLGTSATAANTVKSDIEEARETYLTEVDTNILSQIAFTERGAPE
jgi:hypothetical protein